MTSNEPNIFPSQEFDNTPSPEADKKREEAEALVRDAGEKKRKRLDEPDPFNAKKQRVNKARTSEDLHDRLREYRIHDILANLQTAHGKRHLLEGQAKPLTPPTLQPQETRR